VNFLEIASNVRNLIAQADDGELTADLEQALTDAAGSLNDKHDAIRAVMNELQARGDRRKAEADRVAGLAKKALDDVARLKAWLMLGMRAAGVQKIETDLFKTSIVRNGGNPSVLFDGPVDALPARFQKATTTVSLNRDEVLAAHKAGETLPDGVRVERGERLALK
jgi:hypothetical protein